MRQIFDIHGGIHPPERKDISNPGVVSDCDMPSKLVLPVTQHIGAPARPVVEVGDTVLGGQMIAEAQGPVSVPVHAPSSGTVTASEARAVPHASGLTDTCIEISLDGKDEWVGCEGLANWRDETKAALLERVRLAGIAGLGGAGFPTAIKLASDRDGGIHTLIINGTECEPYITADDTVMQCFAQQIVEGAEILAHVVGAETVLLAVEDNKPEAANAMRQAAEALEIAEVVTFPTKYPSGGEKQLIEILLNAQVPSGGIPADIGVLCQNPSTAIAVRDALIDGKPVTHRITTVTGMSLKDPGNRRVMLGTPIRELLDTAGFSTHPTANAGLLWLRWRNLGSCGRKDAIGDLHHRHIEVSDSKAHHGTAMDDPVCAVSVETCGIEKFPNGSAQHDAAVSRIFQRHACHSGDAVRDRFSINQRIAHCNGGTRVLAQHANISGDTTRGHLRVE